MYLKLGDHETRRRLLCPKRLNALVLDPNPAFCSDRKLGSNYAIENSAINGLHMESCHKMIFFFVLSSKIMPTPLSFY